MIRLLLVNSLLLFISACAAPASYTDKQLMTYDKDTEYAVDALDNGFALSILYSRYQFIPESSAVATACKSALTSIAFEYSDKLNRKIDPINEQRIKLSLGRNGFSGITSCSAYAAVTWK